MAVSRGVALTDFVDPNGVIVPKKGRAVRLALFFTEIVSQASNYEAPTTIVCRRRPRRRLCGTPLTLYFDTENFDVLWFCPPVTNLSRSRVICSWDGAKKQSCNSAKPKSPANTHC
jgi:hypothetical protein